MHDDEIDIGHELVRRLVERDAPELGDLPLRRLTVSGSTNALFGLGADLLVRLPRRPGGGRAIEREARWLPQLAPALPVTVPEMKIVGQPGFGYPETWAVTGWIAGDHPSTPQAPGPEADALARDLARVTVALHAIEVPVHAVPDPALRSYRAGRLSDIDTEIREYLDQCRSLADLPLDLDDCLDIWTEAVALPEPGMAPDQWVHADLFAENLLVHDDRLAAVLDFGALAVGDPSVDLAVAWEVLGPGARQIFRTDLDLDDITWQRGRGWALAIAIMTFPYYWASMPDRCAARLAMAHEIVADHRRS